MVSRSDGKWVGIVDCVVVAVVGCGYLGRNLDRNFLDDPEVDVKYVCDRLSERLRSRCAGAIRQ